MIPRIAVSVLFAMWLATLPMTAAAQGVAAASAASIAADATGANTPATPARSIAADASTASADAAQPAQAQGPMVIERVHDGFAIAPDFRFGKVNGSAARLAGAYGGWMIDNTLLIGAGGYGLTNGSSNFQMGYGGVVVGWLQHTGGPVGFGARTRGGAGRATISTPFSGCAFERDGQVLFAGVCPPGAAQPAALPTNVQVVPTNGLQAIYRQNFFVTEPQADLYLNLGRRIRLDLGVGYRLIGDARGLDNQLRGTTGSVSLQIGGSSTTR
jgi:hypothetical protein